MEHTEKQDRKRRNRRSIGGLGRERGGERETGAKLPKYKLHTSHFNNYVHATRKIQPDNMARPNPKANIAHSFMYQPATADPDLRTMVHLHENSENASLFTPVNLGNHHWKSVDDAKCCSEPTCRRKFDKKLARFELRRNRRNCYMCGLVYCRGCTR